MTVEVVIRSARTLADEVAEPGTVRIRPMALGLVGGEHVDKIGFFEPSVAVVEK